MGAVNISLFPVAKQIVANLRATKKIAHHVLKDITAPTLSALRLSVAMGNTPALAPQSAPTVQKVLNVRLSLSCILVKQASTLSGQRTWNAPNALQVTLVKQRRWTLPCVTLGSTHWRKLPNAPHALQVTRALIPQPPQKCAVKGLNAAIQRRTHRLVTRVCTQSGSVTLLARLALPALRAILIRGMPPPVPTDITHLKAA